MEAAVEVAVKAVAEAVVEAMAEVEVEEDPCLFPHWVVEGFHFLHG